MKKVIYIIMCLCAMASCTERVEYPAEFAVADSLAEYDEAQMALVLLDSVQKYPLSLHTKKTSIKIYEQTLFIILIS